jgi:uncharacterized membrane protein YphA (DoxX/SURF4 family)
MTNAPFVPLGPFEREEALRRLPLPDWLLVLTRVVLGTSFLFSDHGDATPNELAGFLAFARSHAFGWYASFLDAVVIPHAAFFGKLIVVTEVTVGLALILGLATRLAAVTALGLLANYLCAKGRMPWYPGIDASDILLSLILLFTAAGRTFGIDRFLHRRFPRVPLW